MNRSDFSQWSDLSEISTISCSSSIRPLARINSVIHISECQASSSFREPTTKSNASSNVDSSDSLLKINKSMVICQDSISEYGKLKLIQDCVENVTIMKNKCEALSNDVARKLKSILAMNEAKKYLQLPNTDKNNHYDLTLLGITDLPKVNLTHDEKQDIKAAVENILREKLNDFIISYETLGGNVKEAMTSHDSMAGTNLLENLGGDSMRWRDQIDEVRTEYHRDLLRCADLLYQWQRLKYHDMKEFNITNAENLLLQAQRLEMQAIIMKKTCALKMFTETPTTVDAFKILNDNLEDKLHEARENLRSKKALRTTYENIQSSEYNQLLNKYTELCNIIKKKKNLLEKLE